MTCDSFALHRVMQSFRVSVDTSRDLFAHVAPVPLAADTQSVIEKSTPLALLTHTEKARSELLVAPVVAELWLQSGKQLSVHSGVELGIDEHAGLSGVCDFLIGRSPQVLDVSPPILVVMTAKRECISDGYGPCAAKLVAARIANREAKTGLEVIQGCITTGSLWRFLTLRGPQLEIDIVEYHLGQLDRILGILLHMVGFNPLPAVA